MGLNRKGKGQYGEHVAHTLMSAGTPLLPAAARNRHD